MSRHLTLIVCMFFALGCAKVGQIQHLDELLTLKAYSDEKEVQQKWIDGENKKFERLLVVVKDGSMKTYTQRDAILQDFGNPVLTDVINDNEKLLDRWLYRHPIQKMATDRVYIYFTPDGHLIKFEHIMSSSGGL